MRRELATIKIQSQYRMRKQHEIFTGTKKATIALQCRQRRGIAKKALAALKFEQKDIGKLKANNEKLKLEMASLKAMLAAEAKESATKAKGEKDLRAKEEEIAKLEKRIAELESELEKEKELVKKTDKKLEKEKSRSAKREEEISVLRQQNQNMKNAAPPPPASPIRSMKKAAPVAPATPVQSAANHKEIKSVTEILPEKVYIERGVDPQELIEQKVLVSKLEDQLQRERSSRRNADGEVIRLRAEINGVKLDADEVAALIPSGHDDVI